MNRRKFFKAIVGVGLFVGAVPVNTRLNTCSIRKLLYAQIERMGFPLDPWTQAEVFDEKMDYETRSHS